ncbi:hypothetical protein CLAFUW4_04118 [Fulvia fulva]|uniref:Uncharacterized protein n=1 Tax=Passalora fulva TaxID=5499 RepID=A0A9Q8LGU0_PASFU|nr:uncharacterized protein CLAFUR5_04080 [Fulvia fulva]KAK4627015.1 hypothetical protein CLAFUR4_04104 [Fulvia fulva]UJO17125.1 hypothetical protein CLAFUR5_04080 [Fulvia fulva]WPV13269.1 hypothetical protein CLAFUW4_04118 [Fulvia fulva]WPV28706.1 hypothetical protein CLAFUW7_04107 [Fulvia fulva]
MQVYHRPTHSSPQAKALHDVVYNNEDIVHLVLTKIPLAYLRYKRLVMSKATVGYVGILKSLDFHIENHPDIGRFIGLHNNFGTRWRAAGDPRSRRQLIINEVEHSPEHELIIKAFFRQLYTGQLNASLVPFICCGCLDVATNFTGVGNWETDRHLGFCRQCYITLCELDKMSLESLDKCWLGVIPEWEKHNSSLIKWSNDMANPYVEGSESERLASELFWTALTDIKYTSRSWLRWNLCCHMIDRLWYQITVDWAGGLTTEPFSWGSRLGINDFVGNYGATRVVSGRLAELAGADKIVQDMLLVADGSISGSHVRNSRHIRDRLLSTGWTAGEVGRVYCLLAAERKNRRTGLMLTARVHGTGDTRATSDRSFDLRLVNQIWVSLRPGTSFEAVWHDLEHTLADAVCREVLRMWESAVNDDWREYIDLINHGRDPFLDRGRTFDDISDYILTHCPNHSQSWVNIFQYFIDLDEPRHSDIDTALNVWLYMSAEDFWWRYVEDAVFSTRERLFLRSHHILYRTHMNGQQRYPRPPLIVERMNTRRASGVRDNTAPYYELYEFKDQAWSLSPPLRFGKRRDMAWLCRRTSCPCHQYGSQGRTEE